MPLRNKDLEHLSITELVTLKQNIFNELEETITTECALKRSLRSCMEKEYSLQDDERIVLEEIIDRTADKKYKEELRPLRECL